MEVDDEFSLYRAEWETTVGKLIARAWVDPDYKTVLIADPKAALHGEGLVFPDRYVVEFYDDPGAQPGDWHSIGRGSTAVHRFPIPPPPPGAFLNSDTLGAVDGSALACCCPCASCTGAASPETWT